MPGKRIMGEGLFMNFGNISNRLQRYERAKAKLNEFYVSEESRKSNKLGQTSSTELLYSTIRVLSQFAEAYCNDNDKCAEQYNDLSFVASFYENYVVGERTGDDYFFLLIGAIANILSDNFGNAKSLINKICREKIDNEIAILLFEYMANGLGKTYEVLYTCEELRDEYYYHLIDEIVHDTGSVYLYKLRKFSNELLSRNDSESAFYGLMLWAIHKKFLENSAARIIPISAASTLQDWYDYFSQKYAIRILWQAQRLMIESGVLRGESATIQLPTGVGKTKSIELIISAAFLLRGVKLAIVVAPLRALCNEIEKDLYKSLKNIVSITILSDVLDDEGFDFNIRQVIVMTPEKLSFLMRHNSDLVKRCGLIIFDEAHMFDDSSRGPTYEFLIMRVKEVLPIEAQKVFISAIMPNAEELNEWLTIDGSVVTDKDIKRTEKSVAFFSQAMNQLLFYQQNELIELKDEMVYIPQVCPRLPEVREDYVKGKNKGNPKYIFPDLSKGIDVALYLACKLSNSENCSAIYVSKPQQIFLAAKNIVKLKNKNYGLFDNIYNSSRCEANDKILHLAQMHFGENNEFSQMMGLGFYPHFGDLENGLRLSIEHEIRNHNIQCVICTSTLAEGVNLPIKYLFLSTLQDAHGQMISTRKFQNLIGRTARSGVYTEGSIICTDKKYFDDKRRYPEQWNNAIKLFDTSQSEHCNSAILQIISDLHIPYTTRALKGIWLLGVFLKSYSDSVEYDINSWVEEVYTLYVSNYVKKSSKKDIKQSIYDAISARLNQIKHIVNSLESIITEECAREDEKLDEESRITGLAENTLAYKMADEKSKEAIIRLFLTVEQKAMKISMEKRRIYAKSMSGIDILNTIDEYLQNHSEMYDKSVFCEEQWIKSVIDLAESCFDNNHPFNKLDYDVRSVVLQAWVNGESYKNIVNTCNLTIDKAIRVCNKMSYSFNLLISSIFELIAQYKSGDTTDEQWKNFIDDIQLFQKRVRYGLKNVTDIVAYEFGYADRIIANDIGQIIDAEALKKTDDNIGLMKKHRKEIKNRLTSYPNYFRDVIQI